MDALKMFSDLIDNLDEAEKIVKNSFFNPGELDRSLKSLDELKSTFNQYPFLETAISQIIMHNFLSTRETEFDKHKWFSENYKSLLPGSYQLISRPNDPQHIPDFWLTKSNAFIPVEIKLKTFTEKSLKQLQRYMNFYKCNEGIAVAEKATCDLPKNITFIPFNKLEVGENESFSN